MGPAIALFQICHRLNAGGLTLIDETSAAAAFTATFFSQCEYHSRWPRLRSIASPTRRCALVNRPLKASRILITAEDILELPATSRVVPAARVPLQVGSTTSVSVVIPAKNVAAYVGETLASALAQTEVTEVIVVDDGSTDDTPAIVRAIRDPRLRLMTNGAAGVSAARNLGAQHASGQWLLFLDADDRLRPGAVAALLAAARGAPRAVLVYGDYKTSASGGRRTARRDFSKGRPKPPGAGLRGPPPGNFFSNAGMRPPRAGAFRAIGGFDVSLRYCEDWHCWCRLAAIGEFEFAPN